MELFDRLRQPEYTGEKRCIPCTSVNITLAAVGSTLLAKLTSRRLGTTAFGASLGIIYLRGYLVPGTPTITKRHLPEWILRGFNKDVNSILDDTIEIDPERVLLNAGAVKHCEEGTDLCLTDDFRKAWLEQIQTVDTDHLDEDSLALTLGVSTRDNILIDKQSDAFVAYTDNSIISQWGSRAAAIADVAAAAEIKKRIPDWSTLTPAETARVLMSLRIFIEQCPDCGGPVRVDKDIVESCCRSYDVVASSCQKCDSRLFEIEWDEPNLSRTNEPSG